MPGCVMLRAANWNRFNSSLGTSQFKRPNDTSAASSAFEPPLVSDRIGIEPEG